jgi:protein-tyrosine-phosphatase
MPSVLFVCTANICRSPMAMGLLRNQVSQDEKDWNIQSAGVWAQKGHPPSDFGRMVLLRRGIDISDHKSQPVTSELVQDFNLILVMEARHKDALVAAFPAYSYRFYLLSEMVRKSFDVEDPFGMALPDYEDTAQEIEQILQEGFYLIQTLSTNNA